MAVNRLRIWHIVLNTMGILAFVFILVGFVTPGWSRLKMEMGINNSTKIYVDSSVGIWYIKTCVSNLVCTIITTSASIKTASGKPEISESLSSQFGVGTEDSVEAFLGLQIKSTLSIIMVFTALISTAIFSLCQTKYAKRFAILAAVTYALSGALEALTVFTVASGNSEISSRLPISTVPGAPVVTGLRTPYSLVLSAIGGSLVLINAIIICFYIQTLKRQTTPDFSNIEFKLLTQEGEPNING